MEKLIHKNKINNISRGDLLFSETSKKLYMIVELETEKYSLVNLDTGNINYINYTKEEIYNLSKELIHIKNEECKIEIKY